MEDIYSQREIDHTTEFFVVEDGNARAGSFINSSKVVSETEFFAMVAKSGPVNCIIAVAKPEIREKIVRQIRLKVPASCFQNLIHPSVIYDKRLDKLRLGVENIICAKCVLATDSLLGIFCYLNVDCTLGHESILGDFSTFSPGVLVCGNARSAERVFMGTRVAVI